MMARFPQPRSLAVRLFVVATIWTLVALAVAYVMLISFYREGVERGFETLIDLHLFNVVASIEQDEEGKLHGQRQLGDPRFENFHSGWYWQVDRDAEKGAGAVSLSLADDQLELPSLDDIPFDKNFRRIMDIDGPEDEKLRAIEQLIVFEGTGDQLAFTVAVDLDVVNADTARFQKLLLMVFAILGAGLVAITVVQVRIGLKPLRDVGTALTAIREGRAQRLEGVYPREIAPLTGELNALIESNAKVVERARTHVGNLAHALKTPLSVVINEARAANTPLGDKVIEQTKLMRHQIDHYLDRARVVASSDVVTVVTEIEPVAQTFARAMARIYVDRGIEMSLDIEPGVRFQGEKQDLEELFGNLVDNAFKWAASQVHLSCHRLDAAAADGERAMLEIIVEDDGPGLSQAERAEVVRRGKRLDESIPGAGLGLSIVGDLAEMYDGGFALSVSSLGGLKATLRLPAA